jgi:hypothetical protein
VTFCGTKLFSGSRGGCFDGFDRGFCSWFRERGSGEGEESPGYPPIIPVACCSALFGAD